MSKTINSNQIITDQEFQEFAQAIMEHKPLSETHDAHMVRVYAQDRDDLFRILELCMRGNRQLARNLACSLDTLVREIIPNSVWRTLTNE